MSASNTNTITKRELTVAVSAATGLTQEQSLKAIQALLDALDESLKCGKKVVLRNFGTFKVVRKKWQADVRFKAGVSLRRGLRIRKDRAASA